MILCIGPNDKLQIASDVTPNLHVHVSGMDADGAGNITTYRKNTLIATSAATDISAVAASGVTRNIKTINIKNSGSAAVTITVLHTDGTTSVELMKTAIQSQQTIQYVEGDGWSLSQGMPASLELAYVELQSQTAVVATTEAAADVLVTAPALTFDGATKICLDTHFPTFGEHSTSQSAHLAFFEDGVSLGKIWHSNFGDDRQAGPDGRRYLTPSAGTHTYSVRAWKGGSGGTAPAIYAGAGGAGNYLPGFLRISQAVGVTGPQGPSGPAGQVDIQSFTANGTWTKPAWASAVRVIAVGQGGGGGGGANRTATNIAAAGGEGGGGGGRMEGIYRAADLPTSVSVSVAAGANGGAGGTSGATTGLPGTTGGNSSFGTYLVAGGGGAGG